MTDDLWTMIQDCLVTDPSERPSAHEVLRRPAFAIAEPEGGSASES
jgi:hypothetical protein